ncbi:MAG: nucleotidyltransferase family protein [Nitrospirota bacterium]
MKGLILAAGFGHRLRPLTEHLPKPLLPVGGIPLIHYNILLLKYSGITDIVINVHYYAEKIIEALGSGKGLGVHLTYSKEAEILGTGGAIKNLQSQLGDAPFLVINADILVNVDLKRLIAFHQQHRPAATLVLRKDPEQSQYGIIETDANDRIQNILSKVPLKKGRFRKRMFTGIHIITPKVFDYVPPNVFYSITDSYIEMLKKEECLYGYTMRGYWNDIGVEKRYREVNQKMQERKIRLRYMGN